MGLNALSRPTEPDALSKDEEVKQSGRGIGLFKSIHNGLRSLFSRSRVLQKSEGSSSFEKTPAYVALPTTFDRLPLEVLVCIMEYLPAESAAAFCLTSKDFFHTLGNHHFARILSPETTKLDKLALMELLAVDLPDQVACGHWMRLHQIENIRRYDWYRTVSHLAPACAKQDRKDCLYLICDHFSTRTFKMVMKLYCQKSDYAWLLGNLRTSPEIKRDEFYLILYTEECYIDQGRLMQRLQRVYFPRAGFDFNPNPVKGMICPHLHIKERQEELEAKTNRMIECQQCRTQYRLVFKHFENQGLGLVVSIWKDPGPRPENPI
jgi:hypothetical protein